MKKYFKVAILFSILLVLMLAVSGCSIISFNRTGPTSNILSGEIIIRHNYPASRLDETEYILPATGSASSLQRSSDKLQEEVSELIIVFREGIDQDEISSIFKKYNFIKIDDKASIYAYLIKTPDYSIQEAINLASEIEEVKYIEPNYRVTALNENIEIPLDPDYDKQWNLGLIRMPQAWNKANSRARIRVAVLDTGVDINHPDLRANLDTSYAYNFIDNNRDVSDDHFQGHGTHVTGIIAAWRNSHGIAGILENVEILPLKVLEGSGGGSFWNIGEALLYAAGIEIEGRPLNPRPVDIINLSLGGTVDDETNQYLHEIIKQVASRGIIMVAASGNRNQDSLLFPAAYPEVLSAGSVRINNTNPPSRTTTSNYGTDLDFVAPGQSIFSTIPGGGYDYRSGTSMAAPHLTGVVGLLLANDNSLDFADIKARLQRTGMKIEGSYFGAETGYGLINSFWAIQDISQIQVFIGSRENTAFNKKAGIDLQLRDNNYLIEDIPAGSYRVMAWIDVTNNGILSPGDYYAESQLLDFHPDNNYNQNLILKEFRNLEDLD